jgi:signal transduction histidine kinase/DNA-binding response OmpR family regulator
MSGGAERDGAMDLRGATILIADDEPANVELLVACLRDEGYENVVATIDAREIAGLCASLGPDLVLLDLHMPRVDGFQVLATLRDQYPPEELMPVLVLTADVTDATKRRALSSGAKDFLTKPLDITEVLLRIHNLLETRFLSRQQLDARRRAEAAERRAMLLAHASHALASSLDYQTTLSLLCRTVVPQLADFCVVDVLDEDGTIARVGAAHVDPAKEAVLRATVHSRAPDMDTNHPVLAALTEGRHTHAADITPETVAAILAEDDHRAAVIELAPRSLISVPLRAGERVVGALVLVYATSGRRYDSDDLDLACELARRAGLTVENARLYDRAAEATRARDELLAVVAHDLRNPLSTVTMGASALLETATTDDDRKYLEMVRRAAARMERLIEDLLEVSRLERGKLTIEAGPAPVGPLVREAIAMLEPLAAGRGVLLESHIPEDLPPAHMDGSRILQVLSNLVGNALKFTPHGGRVRVECELGEGAVRFTVSDTGAGIPPDQIPHIFGRFWQASDADRRGIGLGLSIVRGLIDAHGGRVWVESDVGVGSRFYFTLPVAARDRARAHAGLASVSDA